MPRALLPLMVAGLLGIGFVPARLQAQPVVPSLYFTNAYVTGNSFHFETSTDLGSGWHLEYKNLLSDLMWLPYSLPLPFGRVFELPMDSATRFFRARDDQFVNVVYSLNLAYYVRHPLTNGFALLGNPYDNGCSNRLSEIMRKPPPGTLACQFSAPQPAWSAVSQYVWDAWTPDLVWPPGQGLAFVLPRPMEHTFAGTTATLPPSPVIRSGAQLLGLPTPSFPSGLLPDDVVFRFFRTTQLYEPYFYLGSGLWIPEEPTLVLGEGYWLVRGGGAGAPISIHLNNYVPSAGIDAPVAHEGRLLEGTNWLAQLYYSLSGPPDTAVGSPVPFRTGAAAGYLDTSAGGVVTLPLSPGPAINLQLRYWKVGGASTGMTAVITLPTSGLGGTPPPVPLNLVGLGGASAARQMHLTRPEWTPGQFQFRFSACVGSNYVIESSTTLTNWSLVRTLSGFCGPVLVAETNATASGFRFYRARVVAP